MSTELGSQSAIEHEIICPRADRYVLDNESHRAVLAERIKAGYFGPTAFNGIYGLFGDADNPQVAIDISTAKQRPHDKKLVLVSDPRYLDEHVDPDALPYELDRLTTLQRSVHALGFILPASDTAPQHLVSEHGTILSIWTEEKSFRDLMEKFRAQGGRAFVGTSANKSNQPTHVNANEVWRDFRDCADFVAVDLRNFNHIPQHRKRSTSVIDFTTEVPTLHRLGSMDVPELRSALQAHGFPPLSVPNEYKTVSNR